MTKQGEKRLLRVGIASCILMIISILVSGPLGLLATLVTKPQPAWVDADTFVAHFDFVQTVPFFFGLLLVAGSLLLVASTYKLASEDDRAIMFPGVILVSIYASLISLNYVVQMTFIPALVAHYSPSHGETISALSMSNPNSLSWAIEMYGYAFLGLATLFLAPFFKNKAFGTVIRRLLMANALISVAGALVTSIDLSWVLTIAGLASFLIWNALYLAVVVLILISFKRLHSQPSDGERPARR